MGKVKFDSRSGTLADATPLTEAVGSFPLPGPNGGKLIQFSVTTGGNSGPVRGQVEIFRGGSNTDVIVVPDGGQFVLRTDSTGLGPDFHAWAGEVDYPGASTLRLILRNDSGATVFWAARWAAVIA